MEAPVKLKALVVICVAFDSETSAGARQMRELVECFAQSGIYVTVICSDKHISENSLDSLSEFVTVLRVPTKLALSGNLLRRFFIELWLPVSFLFSIWQKKPLFNRSIGIIWYSPPIFFGGLIYYLKKRFGCKTYLILRDIFPQWALDLGLIQRGFVYRFLEQISVFQYQQADKIGLQSRANLEFFRIKYSSLEPRLEVLPNWVTDGQLVKCELVHREVFFKDRQVFIYSGNVGIAQAADVWIDVAAKLKTCKTIGFLFVGRGSHFGRLKQLACNKQLSNVSFWDEISSEELNFVYTKCRAGLLSLDQRHTTHNVPGKFLSYINSGLPVIAIMNPGNDLIEAINENELGFAHSKVDIDQLCRQIKTVAKSRYDYKARCTQYCRENYSTRFAASKILRALEIK